MTAQTAFFPKPPRGPLEWLSDFVKANDPTTARGCALYVVLGLALGWLLAGLS